jgi:hypothetical protein
MVERCELSSAVGFERPGLDAANDRACLPVIANVLIQTSPFVGWSYPPGTSWQCC